MEIQSIAFTDKETGSDIYFYRVGFNGVTKIKYIEYSPEPNCSRFYYQVFKGPVLAYELYDVTHVIFSV